ncbi:MAG: YvrJ family protein [Tissierellia bacterium]|nr:YvrJ family protein [Tissierellia bacterium]
MEEVTSLIANLGFPIVMTVFLLTRVEKKLDALTESIASLTMAIKERM